MGRLAPDKAKAAILAPMAQIRDGIQASRGELARFRHAPRFAPAGQSTQMIIGATPESDRHILTLTQALYDKYKLKRVFYSAYMPVSDSALLPARRDFKPPLLREHRLYQADWLLRFYHFRAEELLDEANPNFNPLVDPKCSWALNHPEFFPVEVNRADYEALLRVPGIGVTWRACGSPPTGCSATWWPRSGPCWPRARRSSSPSSSRRVRRRPWTGHRFPMPMTAALPAF